ncbi:hypothetical protein NE236_38255 [Actinoallomurus purpureus]|uniref:hypothetical protein n=1 Tax=Actinoallomurus purpureus TaxID=478114 RepID=UPI002093D9EA|nr:hypothetical protein [Actinoallomurus purpureus]MCO6010818.1 hypothetical protein [Actinoallomurus purpureus]
MTRIGQALRMASFAGVLAVGTIIVPTTAAYASAGNCSNGEYSGNGWWAYCATQTNPGKDGWRAIAYCDHQGRASTTVYGPWKGGVSAGNSYAICPGGYDVVGGTYQTTTNRP